MQYYPGTGGSSGGGKILQVVTGEGDGTGVETSSTAATFIESSLQLSITPTQATSKIVAIFRAYMRAVGDGGSDANRDGMVLLHLDTTAGEGNPANGTQISATHTGHQLTAASTAGESRGSVVSSGEFSPGDTNAHTVTMVYSTRDNNVDFSYQNNAATNSHGILLEIEA